MGIFNVLKKVIFGKDVLVATSPALPSATQSSTVSQSQENGELSVGEILFLQYADGHDADTDTFSKHYMYDYGLNNYPGTLRKLIEQGYITVGVYEQSLNLYKVNDLKAYLKENNMPASGKKQDLIQRIVESSLNYQSYFNREVCRLTDKGKVLVDQYEEERRNYLSDLISKTITAIRDGNAQEIIAEYASDEPPNKPFALPYDTEAVLSDLSAIQEYRLSGHDTDRELAICVASIMFKEAFDGITDILKDIGYSDIQEEEIYTASTAIHSLQEIAEFREIGIQKYRILTCNDSKTCEKCRKKDRKLYPVSKAVLGKTLPPFCSKCRCVIIAEFE